MRVALALLGLAIPSLAFGATPIQRGSNFGLGLAAGMGSTGLSAKYFIGADFALQGTVGLWNPIDIDLLPNDGYSSRNSGDFGLTFDFLFESQPWVNGSAVDLAFDGGMGLSIAPAGELPLGIAIVGGFEVDFEAIPLDLVIEYRPTAWLIPVPDDFGAVGSYVDFLSFGAHIRVYPFPAGPNP